MALAVLSAAARYFRARWVTIHAAVHVFRVALPRFSKSQRNARLGMSTCGHRVGPVLEALSGVRRQETRWHRQTNCARLGEEIMTEHNERWVLNRLIAICRDGERGFRYAANHVRNPTVKALFLEIASQRDQFASSSSSAGSAARRSQRVGRQCRRRSATAGG